MSIYILLMSLGLYYIIQLIGVCIVYELDAFAQKNEGGYLYVVACALCGIGLLGLLCFYIFYKKVFLKTVLQKILEDILLV